MRRAVIIALCLAVGAAVPACTSKKPDPVKQAAQEFLTAYGNRETAKAAGATTDSTGATVVLDASLKGLGETARGAFTVGAVDKVSDVDATATYSATWTLPGSTTQWTYDGSLPVTKVGEDWQVRWQASDVHPGLRAGEHLSVLREQPKRASLTDDDGAPLFTEQPVVTVGIHPANVKNLPSLAATLAKVLNLSAAEIQAQVTAAPKDQFVALITLRKAAYEKVKPQIYDLPGTQFQESTQQLGPTATFAQPLLGRVGHATKEIVDESAGALASGDAAGLSGLQRAYNKQLTGSAGLKVYAENDDGDRRSLADVVKAVPGTDVRLTLDRATQTAAESSLAGVSLPATVVVLEPSSGKVLAVASTLAAANQGNIAFTGQYPPGSTFKIATYAAAFTAKKSLTPASQVDCPATMTVNGQTVRNHDDFNLGRVTAEKAFAYSCNTTAARLGLDLPAGALVSGASALGLGASWTLPVDAFSGSLPEPSGASAENELAADAYGQGKVLVSPLLMASMAGAAQTGRPVAPSVEEGKQAAPGTALRADVTANLRNLMRAVVTMPGATASALAGLPGAVAGKTGTAEFGTDVPPKAHSWFAGTRGDLAFSVFVYGGEDSTTGAVPLAEKFLTAL